jgi:hypothetical protein
MICRFLLLSSLVAGSPRAEIIDRIMVSVGNQVITDSEVRRELRMTAFLNGSELDLGAESRRKAVERLIDQKLIRKEMELGSYPQPEAREAEALLLQVRGQRFHSDAEYTLALKKYGISESDLKSHLLWQLTLLRFVEFRFRGPGGTDGDADTETDKQMELWLKQARARTRISYRPETSKK